MSPFGLGIAALTVLIDQANKAWMLYVYDIGAKGPCAHPVLRPRARLEPGHQLRACCRSESEAGRWGLILFAFAASLALPSGWRGSTSSLAAPRIGLIIGGAIGNAIDRMLYGAVADFFSFHAFGYEWYVFNIADTAIVAGVVGLLYESLFRGHKKVSKPSKM